MKKKGQLSQNPCQTHYRQDTKKPIQSIHNSILTGNQNFHSIFRNKAIQHLINPPYQLPAKSNIIHV